MRKSKSPRSAVNSPGKKHLLLGYEPSLVNIHDPAVAARLGRTHHDNVTPTGDDWSSVQGTVFDVTDEELARADGFEAELAGRERINGALASGKEAWVYVHAPK